MKTTQDQELISVILADLQKYLFNRPLKENTYKEILDRIKSLEDFITSRSKPNFERDKTTHTVMLKLYQNPVFKTIIDIRMGIENIVEKEVQNQKINTFKNETEFFLIVLRN